MSTREATGVVQIQFTGVIQNILNADEDAAEAAWGEVLSAISLSTGSEDNQINRAISKKGMTLASAATMLIDMFDFAGFDCGAGDGKDMLGQSMALEKIVGLLIVLKAASDGELVIGAENSSAALNSIFNGRDDAGTTIQATAVNPGIFFLFNPADGYSVTDVTNHLLKLESRGGVSNFSFYMIGRDAA